MDITKDEIELLKKIAKMPGLPSSYYTDNAYLLKKLEKKGLIKRYSRQNAKWVFLTEAGEKLLKNQIEEGYTIPKTQTSEL